MSSFSNIKNIKKINSEELNILYVGNVGDGQGLEKIIPNILLNTKKKIKFKIIGGGRKLELLKSIIDKNNLLNCKFLDPMNRNMLIQEYISADILFLHLNNYEAFKKVLPSKIFEYAASSKPIIAGLEGYSKKFINDNIDNSYIFRPCNHIEALDKIQMINLNHVNRENFINKFSRKKITYDMLNSILTYIHDFKK